MTPLILLPGMMCDDRLYRPQVETFSRQRTCRVMRPTGQDSMSSMAAQILAEAPDQFALGGLSMGGILAMEIVRQSPERVAGLALMDTNPLAEPDEFKARRLPQMERAKAGQLESIMRDEMMPFYLADPSSRGDLLELCLAMALRLGPDVFREQSLALRDRPDQTETLRAYDKPSLVLCGREDRLCPVKRHTLMHDLLPRSELVILEGAGHLPTLEAPDETTAAMANWLAEVDRE